MNQNLGRLDRVLRFALAFWWLGPFAPSFGIPLVDVAVFIVALIALLESFTGWCLLHSLFGIDNKNQ
ncbi:MAG: hypothetical protein UX77_C0035G0009 [Parcubacteria group bacterium GW2011_GWA1_47_11]|nr:MAG: hypothetical protein UX77_C0035G0009 [Parcubacteria group bacterium GW2011_GWA1_47_11]